MKQKWLLFLSIISTFILLSGCWDKKELTDLAIVNAIGVDKTENGKYLLTFQIINPGNVASQQSTGGGGSGIPVTVYSTIGSNITDAARNASREISRVVYYAHANLVVIGKDLAKEGVYPIFDSLERDSEFRTTATIVISENTKAEDMLKMLTPIDKLPANKITKALRFTEQTLGENINVSVDDVIADLVSPGKEPTISTFSVKGNIDKGKGQANTETTEAAARIVASGLGLFKNGKLESILKDKHARGAVWILDKLKHTDVSIDWKGKKDTIVYEVVRGKTHVNVKTKNRKPVIHITVEAEGEIGEADVPLNLTDPLIIHQLEMAAEKKIKKEVETSLKMVQEQKTDVLGFGELIHQSSPKLWAKMKNDWDNIGFPELEVKIKVEAFIRRTGLRTNPYLLDLK